MLGPFVQIPGMNKRQPPNHSQIPLMKSQMAASRPGCRSWGHLWSSSTPGILPFFTSFNLLGLCTNHLSRGSVNSFGVFQNYYNSELLSDVSNSNISWVGSVQACLLCLMGFITGPLFDIGYAYHLLYIGSFLVVFGMFMTSLCSEFWQIMLAQGICIGLGSGCLFIPSVGIVSTYFSTRKALATGLAVSGSSIGGVVYSIAFSQLQQQIGFRWATRVMGFIMLATLLVAIAVYRVRVLPPEKRRLLDLQAFKEPPFAAFNTLVFFTCVGLYVPYFYISSWATREGIMSPSLAFNMVPILSAGSVFGRILPNLVADKLGPINMMTVCTTAACVLGFCWIAIHNIPGIIVFCVLYGFFSGSFVSLQPAVVVTLSPSLGIFGTRMGMSSCFSGLGILVGNPVAGAIVGDGSWLGIMLFCGCSLAVGASFAYVTKFVKSKEVAARV